MGERALRMREVAGSMPASSINERFAIGCTRFEPFESTNF